MEFLKRKGIRLLKAKKVWDKLFIPHCFGNDDELQKCVDKYFENYKAPCKYYTKCLEESSKRWNKA